MTTRTEDRTAMFSQQMQVTSPYVFFGVSGLIVAYLLYMIFRKRKGERPGNTVREPEL